MNDYMTLEEWTKWFDEAYGHLGITLHVNVRDRNWEGMSRKICGRKSTIKRRTR